MKKFAAILLAASALASCSAAAPEPVLSEPVPEIAAFAEYTDDDFSKVNIKISRPEVAPPVSMKEYDLSGIRHEAKLSPCKAHEYSIERLKEVYITDEEYDMDAYLAGCEDFLTTPALPSVKCTASDGRYFYYIANYDDFCFYESHCFGIFRYDLENGENTCIFEYSDPVTAYKFDEMKLYGGDIWLTETGSEPSVYRFDTEKSELCRVDGDFDGSYYIMFCPLTEDRLCIYCNDTTRDENACGVYEYDENSRKMERIFSGSRCITSWDGQFFDDGKNDDGECVFSCDRFRLTTNLKSGRLFAVTESAVVFMVETNVSKYLRVYDLNSMEQYALDIKSLTSAEGYAMGSHLIIGQLSNFSYLIPELGTLYTLTGADPSVGVKPSFCGRCVTIAETAARSYADYTPDGISYEQNPESPIKRAVIMNFEA